MAKIAKRRIGFSILVGVIISICMLCYGAAFALVSRTLITGWIPFAISFVLALISGSTLWKIWIRITESENFWINYLCHIAAATGIIATLLLGCNYFFADEDTLHTENVTVERKYYKTRHRSRRVGRRYTTNGEPYKVYYMEIRFSDGRLKEQSLSFDEYRKTKKGKNLEIPVEKGLFGINVIK